VNKRFEVQKKLFCREESNNYNTRNGMLLCICAVNQNSLCIHSEHTLQSFPVDRLHSDKHTTVRPQYTIVYYSPPQYTRTHHSILKYTTAYYSKLNYTTGYYRTPQDTTEHHRILQNTTTYTLKFALGHSANTGCTKVGVPGLDAAQAAEVLVPRLEEKQ